MAQKSSNSSRATWRDYPHWSSVERFVEQVRRLDPLLVLLFGSVTTGEFTQYSDADDVYERLQRHVAAARERWGLERTADGWRWTA